MARKTTKKSENLKAMKNPAAAMRKLSTHELQQIVAGTSTKAKGGSEQNPNKIYCGFTWFGGFCDDATCERDGSLICHAWSLGGGIATVGGGVKGV